MLSSIFPKLKGVATMINIHWNKPASLQKDKKEAYKLITKQGMILCFDDEERQYAKEIFKPLGEIFKDEILSSSLSFIYLYDQNKQPPSISENDGYSSISKMLKYGRRVSAIGISIQALHETKEYAIMVFLHELAHILYEPENEHDYMFHNYLNYLIARYNDATGEYVKNDYYGLTNKNPFKAF